MTKSEMKSRLRMVDEEILLYETSLRVPQANLWNLGTEESMRADLLILKSERNYLTSVLFHYSV